MGAASGCDSGTTIDVDASVVGASVAVVGFVVGAVDINIIRIENINRIT